MRLKQAKEDAQAEIKSFRDEKEKEFKEFESKVKLFILLYYDYSLKIY